AGSAPEIEGQLGTVGDLLANELGGRAGEHVGHDIHAPAGQLAVAEGVARPGHRPSAGSRAAFGGAVSGGSRCHIATPTTARTVASTFWRSSVPYDDTH